MAKEYVAFCTNKPPAPITSVPSGTLVPLRFNSNSLTDHEDVVRDLVRMVGTGAADILDAFEADGATGRTLPAKVEALSGVIEVLRNKL